MIRAQNPIPKNNTKVLIGGQTKTLLNSASIRHGLYSFGYFIKSQMGNTDLHRMEELEGGLLKGICLYI